MLSGKRLIELADKAIKEHPEAFEAMLEFERTKKLPRPQTKERVNFTLDRNLIRRLREHSRKKNQKMSNLIEELIKEKLAKPF